MTSIKLAPQDTLESDKVNMTIANETHDTSDKSWCKQVILSVVS